MSRKVSQIHEVIGVAEPSPVCRRRSMRILCDLQLSNKLPNSGRFLFAKDSNTIANGVFLQAIRKIRPDWSVTVMVPYPDQIVGIKGEQYAKDDAVDRARECFRGVGDWENLHLIPYRYFPEAFTQRFNFNVNEIAPRLKSLTHEYDLVYCNEPTQAQNWNMMMFARRMGDIVPVVSFYHWITGWTDRKGATERLDWMIRQGEGLFHSTLSLAASKTALSLLIEGLRPYFNRSFFERTIPKLGYVAPPTDLGVLLSKKDLGNRSTEGPLRFLWAHRLNDYTGWDKTFDAMMPLHQKNPGSFTVWVPDPGDREDQNKLKEQWPFIEVLDKTAWSFDDYAKLCWSSHVVLGNHQRISVWGGLSLSEPIVCGCMPLVPDTSWYREQVGPTDDAGINYFEWKNPAAFTNAVEKLLAQPREWVIAQGQKMAQHTMNTINVDPYAERIVGYLESVCYPRREKKWTGYIQDAARAGHLGNDYLNVGQLYEKMQEWSKMGNLVDKETGKKNGWPFVRKNLWPAIRRQLLDHEIMVDDPKNPNGVYKIGPKVNETMGDFFEPDELPVWKDGNSSPWFHRNDTAEMTVALKGHDGVTHPAYSMQTEEAIEGDEPERADPVEFEDVAEAFPELNKKEEPKAKKKREPKVKIITEISQLPIDILNEKNANIVNAIQIEEDKKLPWEEPKVADVVVPEVTPAPQPAVPEVVPVIEHKEGMTQVSETKVTNSFLLRSPVRTPIRTPIKKTE